MGFGCRRDRLSARRRWVIKQIEELLDDRIKPGFGRAAPPRFPNRAPAA